jgi:hypothetical protein
MGSELSLRQSQVDTTVCGIATTSLQPFPYADEKKKLYLIPLVVVEKRGGSATTTK